MEIFLLSFVVLAIAILGMAIGVLFGRRGIKGSCGGLKTIEGLESDCPVCSGTCEEKNQQSDA
ncbi:MAG: (Na+)-NQR maturation NqrM [Acidiferrobacterales bacterium]